jgi:hypothetical protein
MSSEIVKITNDSSRTQQIEQLSNNDQILEGRIEVKKIDTAELDQIFNDLQLSRKYRRNKELGHTAETYTNWTHVSDRGGYSIWSYPVTDLVDNTNNILVKNDKVLEYKGEANSENITSFNKVLVVYDGVCVDRTTEAGSEGGVAFCYLQDSNSDTCLLICGDTVYDAIDFDLETLGSNYNLRLQYWNGYCWSNWDGTCNLSGWTDNTENFHYSGRIEYNIPNDWTQSQIDGTTGYWIKMYTVDTPFVVAKAYSILPGDSVITLLSLTEKEVLNEKWKWCYYNDKVYVTIKNSGDSYYCGNLFIKASSSIEDKQNYFINNNLYSLSYETDTYSFPEFRPNNFCLKVQTRSEIVASSGRVGEIRFCSDVPANNPGTICIYTGSCWVGLIRTNYLLNL